MSKEEATMAWREGQRSLSPLEKSCWRHGDAIGSKGHSSYLYMERLGATIPRYWEHIAYHYCVAVSQTYSPYFF